MADCETDCEVDAILRTPSLLVPELGREQRPQRPSDRLCLQTGTWPSGPMSQRESFRAVRRSSARPQLTARSSSLEEGFALPVAARQLRSWIEMTRPPNLVVVVTITRVSLMSRHVQQQSLQTLCSQVVAPPASVHVQRRILADNRGSTGYRESTRSTDARAQSWTSRDAPAELASPVPCRCRHGPFAP